MLNQEETTASDQTGPPYDGTCEICKIKTESLAANPGLWPVRIIKNTYHWECAHNAITSVASLEEENKRLSKQLEEKDKEIARLRVGLFLTTQNP